MSWNIGSHNKYLLQYHLILVIKYRKQLFINNQISDDIKQFSYDICKKHNINIKYMETDKDHIHYMIETKLNMNLSIFIKTIKTIKSYTTYNIWKKYDNFLKQYFWKEHTFWTDGYFICLIGNVSEEALKSYIKNQG